MTNTIVILPTLYVVKILYTKPSGLKRPFTVSKSSTHDSETNCCDLSDIHKSQQHLELQKSADFSKRCLEMDVQKRSIWLISFVGIGLYLIVGQESCLSGVLACWWGTGRGGVIAVITGTVQSEATAVCGHTDDQLVPGATSSNPVLRGPFLKGKKFTILSISGITVVQSL